MRGARILLVEDEVVSRRMLGRMLESRGLTVDAVEDGPACMERLEQDVPDLVVLDIGLPGMSGLDVLRWIRGRRSAGQLPVILVSALDESEDMVAGLEAGANDYVTKPVNLPVLLARIEVALGIKRSVERLVEAERHRVKLQALGDACGQLSAPMSETIEQIEQLIEFLPEDKSEVRRRLEEIHDWARRAGDLIERFQKLASYQTEPYTDGIGGFVAASLEEALSGVENGS